MTSQRERTIDPNCQFAGFCGDPVDGRLCDTCMIPSDYGPEPEYNERRITQECKPCAGCGKDFVVRDKGIDGDLAWVFGDHYGYTRYHPECWPWRETDPS